MPTERRHVEFFGPDLGRGPFASSQLDAAAVQIATALAQLRVPLLRSDADIKAHADFIRELADKLAPDSAGFVSVDLGAESANLINVSLRLAAPGRSLLRLWLADSIGGGETSVTPSSWVYSTGTLLQSVTTNKHHLVVTSATGLINLTLGYGGAVTWYLGVARSGRVFYSNPIIFV
jgi:hypothetical protein